MKTEKRFLVYYNEGEEVIGLREHHFDWEEGDVITTNGRRTVIFGIFEGTDKNRGLAGWLFRTLRSFLPKKKREKVSNEDHEYNCECWLDEEFDFDAIKEERKQFIDAKRQIWKDFDAELDFIDSILAKMEE